MRRLKKNKPAKIICGFTRNKILYFPKIFAPKINTITNNTKKIKNKTLAIEAAPAAIPVNPKTAAIIAITKKIAAHFSIKYILIIYFQNHARVILKVCKACGS